MWVVSEPTVGSVTPKAWRRSSPDAIAGRYCCFCALDPCRRIVPIVYICAWHAAALPPEALISSRMTLAAVRPSPAPPYSSGISAASHPFSVSAATNSSGVAVGLEAAPVLAGEALAQLADGRADLAQLVGYREVHQSRAWSSSNLRAMTSCWISFEPSPRISTGASRYSRSTTNSCE